MMAGTTLEQLFDSLTVEGDSYERLPDNAERCYACGHRCLIRADRRGTLTRCAAAIAGVWPLRDKVRIGMPEDPFFFRAPRRVHYGLDV